VHGPTQRCCCGHRVVACHYHCCSHRPTRFQSAALPAAAARYHSLRPWSQAYVWHPLLELAIHFTSDARRYAALDVAQQTDRACPADLSSAVLLVEHHGPVVVVARSTLSSLNSYSRCL
jgi:hypothetical protein